MKNNAFVKRIAYPLLKSFQIDRLFQYLNKKKILILAYHGITRKTEGLRPWTTIPVDAFEEQIHYISRRYRVLSLPDVVDAMSGGEALPDHSAVITFDDGYRNNLTLALPILQKYSAPATIFLTTGYVGSDRLLPLDEAFLILSHARRKILFELPEINIGPISFDNDEALYSSYLKMVATLKRIPTVDQTRYLTLLRDALNPEYHGSETWEDFQLLSWEEVQNLLDSGLIEVGAHTVSHEILSNVPLHQATGEIVDSKTMIEERIAKNVTLFAYPNGTIADYAGEHIQFLRDSGFSCSVTTTGRLNAVTDDPYRLGRICVGPDFVENPSHFALKISGFNTALKSIAGRHVI